MRMIFLISFAILVFLLSFSKHDSDYHSGDALKPLYNGR